MKFQLRKMAASDWDTVLTIYLEGIATGEATFEVNAPSWKAWDASHLPFARLVATSPENRVVGWAALSSVSTRVVYAGVAEVSVYVGAAARGLGIGKALLEQLIHESEANGIWTLQAGIFPENHASVVLHKSLGFRLVGRRERIGRLNNRWRDTVLLERRSKIVGKDG
jgi:L-amino acid N-acyltransferase YncA